MTGGHQVFQWCFQNTGDHGTQSHNRCCHEHRCHHGKQDKPKCHPFAGSSAKCLPVKGRKLCLRFFSFHSFRNQAINAGIFLFARLHQSAVRLFQFQNCLFFLRHLCTFQLFGNNRYKVHARILCIKPHQDILVDHLSV